MADETEGRRNEQLSGIRENQRKYTPRKVRHDGGRIKQTRLRQYIADAMRDEMIVCSMDDFLGHLLPFTPDDAWIKSARGQLEKKELLVTPAKTTSTATAPDRRTTNASARARKSVRADIEVAEPKVDAENTNLVRWKAYRYGEPKQSQLNEMKTYRPLEEIVNALPECPDPNPDSTHEWNGYRYKNCPSTDMHSEITGANFKVDSVIAKPDIYEGEKDLAAAQTAVAMEYKKEEDPEKVYDNRMKLVAAANHIMNEDPRRNWMYGITIENTSMSLWYFSCSYSMKSTPIDFTKDIDKFIHIFLSFLYATDEELGHDPSIYRGWHNKTSYYVYKMQTQGDPRYYKTVESLYTSRPLCITGRKSRVWKVVEVTGPDGLEQKSDASEVALKDCWIDKDALPEKEIQRLIFERLAAVQEAEYAWVPTGLRDKVKASLRDPDKYVMKIELDCKLGLNKAKPESRPDPNQLLDPIDRSLADTEKAIPSTQTPPGSGYPSSQSSHVPLPHSPFRVSRRYNIKQHYRVIYAEVGEPLASATTLIDAVRAFEDTFIALTLLFLAGWVHRDVSEGNIILLRNDDGVRAKLSDLEYARCCFGDKTVSTDPKTGTPYFMPVEIHKGSFLFRKALSNPRQASSKNPKRGKTRKAQQSNQTKRASPFLTYTFAHDLESLWWIMIWILLVRVKGGLWLDGTIFAVLNFPHPSREDFFMMGDDLYEHLEKLINDTLCDCEAPNFLTTFNHLLYTFYESGDRTKATAYQHIYEGVWEPLEDFVQDVSDVNMELEDPHLRPLPLPKALPADSEIRKRARSVGVSDTPAEGSSKKKQKSGGDVFSDTVENESAEDDTAEDDLPEDDATEDDPAEDYTVEDDSGEDYTPGADPAEDDMD